MGFKDGLTIVGDLAFDIKKQGDTYATNIGGGAYGCMIGASYFTDNVGVVAPVGDDFDLEALRQLGIDLTGVAVIPGEQTPTFTLEITDDKRIVTAGSMGLIEKAHTYLFPHSYLNSNHVHLATSHPQKYLEWITYLRENSKKAKISVDAFESYARDFPQLVLDSMAKADMIFLNADELLFLGHESVFSFSVPIILKHGRGGVDYFDRNIQFHADAPEVDVQDTTGAGDVFAGAFLAQLMMGIPHQQALNCATRLASQSVTQVGLSHLLSTDTTIVIPREK